MGFRVNPSGVHSSAQPMLFPQYNEHSDRDVPSLRGRVTASELNWTKVFAVSMIVTLAIAVPVAAAGVAAANSALQQDSSPSCSGSHCGSNGTCSTAVSGFYSPAIVEQYTYRGTVEDPDDTSGKEKARGNFWSSQLHEQYFKETMSKVDKYLERAATFEVPADRAVTLHRAREIVHQAQSKSYGAYRSELEYRSATILAEEVEACQQAAERAPTPYKKLKWVRRAMEEMNLPTSRLESSYSCFLKSHDNTCRVAASLWAQAAEAFLQYPERAENHCYGLINPFSEVFCDRLFAAARCFRNSAYCQRTGTHVDDREKATKDLTRALQLQKNIDTSSWSLKDRAKLQEEIADTQYSLCAQYKAPSRVAELSEKVCQESIEAHRLYDQLSQQNPDNVYYQVKSAEQLYLAGNFAATPQRQVELYRQSRDLLEKSWSQDSDRCELILEFTRQNRAGDPRPSQNLLQFVQSKLQRAEADLLEETLKPPHTTISYWVRRARDWLYT